MIYKILILINYNNNYNKINNNMIFNKYKKFTYYKNVKIK
jgi:hypothetical protein